MAVKQCPPVIARPNAEDWDSCRRGQDKEQCVCPPDSLTPLSSPSTLWVGRDLFIFS